MPENRPKTERKVPRSAFKPGQSGNPGGRPKRTKEEKDALQMIRALCPLAAEKLREIIENPDVKVSDQLRAIEIIFERTYGRAYATETGDNEPVKVIIDV